MRILVTGARGMVGTALCNNLKNIRDGKNRTRPGIKIDEIYEYDIDSTPEELDDLEDVAALQGIAHVPARVKCAVLAWHTLEEALDGEGKTDKVTTEDQE